MRKVQIYIENQKVDLFEDENIEITSTIQNIADISKVFTDFSQSFTIPATKRNNAIFDHYYNNDVDGTYDAQVRVSARIEINHVPFRRGKIQLEGAETVKGKAESYSVTFFGSVVTLKDLFGDDKLRDLDYSSLQSTYSGANIQSTITSTSELDVRYPLISSERVWTYGDTPATTDINDSGSPIVYTELFPAIKDSKIFSLIESKYGVNFIGNFLDDSNYRFSRAYTYWKNSNSVSFLTEPLDITFTGGTVLSSNVANIDYTDINTVTQPGDFDYWTGIQHHKLKIVITPSSYVQYYVDVYVDGTYAGTHTSSNNVNQFYVYGGQGLGLQNIIGLEKDVTFKIRSVSAMTFTADVRWEFHAQYYSTNNNVNTTSTLNEQYSSGSLTTLAYFDFSGTAPDMKISDWFSGSISEFNGTCYPTETPLEFQIEPLNDWYKAGEELDITPYVDIDSIKISRPKLYNELNFSFIESKSFMNEAYKDLFNKNYGDLKQVLGYDGGKYEIKLPFENLLFQAFTSTDLQVGYCLTRSPDYKPYVPKVIKLYLQDSTACDFHFNNGSTVANLTTYMPFGQDVTYNTSPYSSNWGNEQSSLLEVGVENSRYQTYYQKYLVNLFNPKTRVIDLKCILPLGILTSLTLDDKLLIRDKWHRINTMKSNLTTGVVDLQLISDWTKGVIQEQLPSIPCAATSLNYSIQPIRPRTDADIANGGGYVSISTVQTGTDINFISDTTGLGVNVTTSTILTIVVDANTSGVPRTNTIQLDYYNSAGVLQYTDYIVIYQLGCESYILAEDGSILMTEALENLMTE